ncbi:zinc finger MYM-type protein 1-like [Galendromus occidentalis]|uniref:Zinc finger MYM-type protein 1-like n=1 Tax=Galendromus occidentalis TaxID=34638 RepID=A0AAJ6QRA0_9ACAR|nr:zinc finger MYM-type protein 1-like [Galendromus occidentalis]
MRSSQDSLLPRPTDRQKYELLFNCWKPDANYVFPKVAEGQQTRAFQLHYLRERPWLAYTELHGGGALCKFCILFAKTESSGPGRQWIPKSLVSSPQNKYKKARQVFAEHKKTRYHQEAELDGRNFIERFGNGDSTDVRSLVDKGRQQQIAKNRSRWIPIIKTIIFCGKQGVALRGHRDAGIEVSGNIDETEQNDGNFRGLLRFRMDAGDESLKEHFLQCGRNAAYTSVRIQNEVIDSIGVLTRKKIVAEVNASRFFSVLADETTDISKIDQLTICLRYVSSFDGQQVLRENFLSFSAVTDKTGAGLAATITRALHEEGIIVANMRGQGYDGCSSMRGKYKGVQAEIKKIVPKALYSHCASHCLNLALAHSIDDTRIRLTVGTIASTCSFMSASPCRVKLLHDTVETMMPEVRARRRRLKPLCATRRVESHKAFITFKELLSPMVSTLETIATQRGDPSARANELLCAICKGEFVISLFVIERFAALFLPLSIQLQSKSLDVFAARDAIESFRNELNSSRLNADSDFKTIFDEATTTCAALQIDIRLPRLCNRQTQRDNHASDSIEQYFRVCVYLPYADRLVEEFTSLFQDMREEALKIQFLLPNHVERSSFDDLAGVLSFYEADLDCSTSVVREEYRRWKAKWSEAPEAARPVTAIYALNHCCPTSFPKMVILLKIFAVLPMTTSSAERTFSVLRLLKTYLRSTMTEQRLNGLASMRIHPEICVAPDEILDSLASKPRRLDLVL